VFGALVSLTGGYATPYVLAGLSVLAAAITLARRAVVRPDRRTARP
jgi:hypothetical protein